MTSNWFATTPNDIKSADFNPTDTEPTAPVVGIALCNHDPLTGVSGWQAHRRVIALVCPAGADQRGIPFPTSCEIFLPWRTLSVSLMFITFCGSIPFATCYCAGCRDGVGSASTL